MPNWCYNTVTLVHEDRKMISRAVKAAQKDALLHEFAPIPQALSETTEGSFGDALEQARLSAQREGNRKTYGYSSWYDFAIGEWGTKWDISNGCGTYKIKKVANGYSVTLGFDTAWSPPINFYNKLLELEFSIDAMFYEPGANFCGRYYDGDEDTYDLSNLTSEEVKDQLPVEIDEHWGISQEMAEYEAEENE